MKLEATRRVGLVFAAELARQGGGGEAEEPPPPDEEQF